ncbi:MAG: hypothetical protein LBS95_00450 [Mycoplasmataceae bacterium]|nr:hypothetical protein [Mycoplasmataceae bacterium]
MRSKILIAMLLGVLYSLATTVFVKNTSLYTGGTSAFFFGIARLTRTIMDIKGVGKETTDITFNALFWGLYLLMNIPLFLLAYKKVGKHFAIISMSFLIVNQIYGFFWGMIPNLSLNIFGETSNVNKFLSEHYGLDVITFNTNIFPGTEDVGVWWTCPDTWSTSINDGNMNLAFTLRNSNFSAALSLFFYSCFFSVISAYAVCFLFIIGGSSAGSDFITIWYSVKKHKNIGKIYAIINTAFLLTGVVLGSFVSGILAWNDIAEKNDMSAFASNPMTSLSYLFSANLLCSLLWVVLNGILIEKLFPSKKLVKCEVKSNELKTIAAKIFSDETYKIYPIKKYTTQTQDTIKFICSYLEFTYIYKEIKNIDKKAYLISSYVQDIDGPLDAFRNNFHD